MDINQVIADYIVTQNPIGSSELVSPYLLSLIYSGKMDMNARNYNLALYQNEVNREMLSRYPGDAFALFGENLEVTLGDGKVQPHVSAFVFGTHGTSIPGASRLYATTISQADGQYVVGKGVDAESVTSAQVAVSASEFSLGFSSKTLFSHPLSVRGKILGARWYGFLSPRNGYSDRF